MLQKKPKCSKNEKKAKRRIAGFPILSIFSSSSLVYKLGSSLS